MKMWAGRFKKELDKEVNDFNSSLRFDCRMYKWDIEGSVAHAKMLAKQGIISLEDSQRIEKGLYTILADIESGALTFDNDAEDIHMFIEQELTNRIGLAGKRLHTARSRNDQVAVDLRMYLREEIVEIKLLLNNLIEVINTQAAAHNETYMPGYTHLQRAQPITYAHYLTAYSFMFIRDAGRLDDTLKRLNIMPLGSGALAGTTYPIDRSYTAQLLSFDGVCENSLDGVSDRDFAIELASCLSILMMHMSRFAEEIILHSSSEFAFIELDDAYSTGSSIMPQKKNPDIAELVRGKTGRVYGDLTALLTLMKGIPLAYNKDMQEDKEAIFDAVDNTKLCLSVFAPMLATCTVRADKMLAAASGGFINATDCADYLTKKGLAFREAYKVSGELVAICIEKKTTLEELPIEEYRAVCELFGEDVYDAINIKHCAQTRTSYGGPSKQSVDEQIRIVGEYLKSTDNGVRI